MTTLTHRLLTVAGPLRRHGAGLWVMLLLLLTVAATTADARPNARRRTTSDAARQQFETVYNRVFGPQGCTLHYDVNIVGLYKTSGTIWYKGQRSKFTDSRADSWNDGTTIYTVYRKKKVVQIDDAHSEKRDKYSSKFKFTLDDFDYAVEQQDTLLLFTLRQRPEAKGTVKEVRALVGANSMDPVSIRVKVALFWANIKISNFRSGGISDQLFVFPRQQYTTGYRYVDKR